MAPVRIYTTATCPYCFRAKGLLRARNVAFDEIDVSSDRPKRAWLAEVTGRTTVPQIFIGEEPIGGYDDLSALDRSGELAKKLSAPAPT